MSGILLQIDGKEVEARAGMTILQAAQSAGIVIPTLCHHEKLDSYGACRICTVEENLVVRTRSEKVDKIRKMVLELLLAHAPDAPALQDLAREYGANEARFEKKTSFFV